MLIGAVLMLFQLGSSIELPLNRVAAPTSIEGTPLTIYVSGTAEVGVTGDGATVEADLKLDISDLQRKFSSIVRARTSGTVCEEELTLTAAALRWTGSYPEAAATATRETWRCEQGKKVASTSREQGAVRFRIDVQRTADEWISFGVTAVSVEGSDRLKTLVAHQLAGTMFSTVAERALSSSVSRETLTAPLAPEIRVLQPRIKAVEFLSTGTADILLHVSASLVIPSDKIPAVLAWAVGG